MSNQAAARILIADDEPLYSKTTAALLRKAGYHCVCAPDGQAALDVLAKEPFDLVLSDLNMPGNLRLELLHEGRRQWPETPLIVVTGAPSLPTAIESVRLGITDYLLKPVKFDDLLASVKRALSHRKRRTIPIADLPATENRFPDLIGNSPPMQELFEVIERVAATDANILITGESGTGKEAVANAIHRRSPRREKAFQVIDCTAIPETLFESLLFGHVKGAFTGAIKDQQGLLTHADGGTAFVDEVGELPAPLQSKLLRVIQEQTFIPLGKSTAEQIDTRFVCATNRDLAMEVNAGRFRRDLFYRLAVIHIELPALRERGDDVVLLAQHFLQYLTPEANQSKQFSEAAVELLTRYLWPGNIRELRNVVEHGLAMSRAETITPQDLPVVLQRSSTSVTAGDMSNASSSHTAAVENASRDYLISLLRENLGNVSRSAAQAGMSRQGMHKLLKKHQIDAADFRD
jgi:two-component system response regulator AtoC